MEQEETQVSLNEVEQLCAKAARGMGAGWGVAEDIARAVRWMARRKLNWSAPMLRMVESEAGADRLRPTFHVADLLAAGRPGDSWKIEGCEPIWTLAILSAALQGRDMSLDVAWDGCVARLQAAGSCSTNHPMVPLEALGPRPIVVTAAPAAAPAFLNAITVLARRSDVTSTTWQKLQTCAARTYVASSEQSRAGAGGTRADD